MSHPRRLTVLVLMAGALAGCGQTAHPHHAITTEKAGPGPRNDRAIDRRYLDVLPFGTYSHWIQPWRAYLDTPRASVLRDALGINFDVTPQEALPTARLLQVSGFRRARIEVGWNTIDYGNPSHMRPSAAAGLRTILGALRTTGIRPLIVLDANEGEPCPVRKTSLGLVAPARAGDSTVRLSPTSLRSVVPGRTGLDATGHYQAAAWIIRSVGPDGVATLAAPLTEDLPSGPHSASTLRFLPFAAPHVHRHSGLSPEYRQTLRGWLSYVGAVGRTARSALGGSAFDVEIWNELSFGSDFLHLGRYFAAQVGTDSDEINTLLPRQTVAWLRDLRHGLARVGITNGFASQSPFDSGATSPPGLTALSKHPYAGLARFPQAAVVSGNRPVDARGRPDGQQTVRGEWRPSFTPRYDALFPEYFLTALQTETLIRDISPYTTSIYGVAHGRRTHPRGSPPPAVWVTEYNLDPAGGNLQQPETPIVSARHGGVPAAEDARLQAKVVLRALSAYVNKGVSAMYFYAAKAGGLSLISPSFFTSLGTQRKGTEDGGFAMSSIRRFTAAFSGPSRVRQLRPLSLLHVNGVSRDVQFRGQGTVAHPDLVDSDVLAFLPFQVSDRRYVVPVYVMTRDVRAALPAEHFDITIGGLAACPQRVSAYDPVSASDAPAALLSCRGGVTQVRIDATDSPRLLELDLP